MHTKTDSEVTSLDASSTTRSPRRPAYYVQSPSHDGEKTTTSFHSTPVISPMGSPPHSHSSSSRFSGSRKLNNNNNHRSNTKPWKEIDVIEEEGLLNNQDHHHSLSRRWYFLAFILGFFLLFTLFSLILWGASRPMKPHVMIKSIKFEHVRVQAGSDATGVATDMITVNATVKFTYRNKGTFFGVHVSSTPLDLSYSEIVIGTGNMKKFYQSRRSQRLVSVAVMGSKIPLYGSGASLSSTTGMPTLPVPLKLSFEIRSRAYVLGKLVKPKYYKKVHCSVVFDPKKINVSVSLKKSCTYD